MCYPAPLIKGKEEFDKPNNVTFPDNSNGFYLPLPDEWIKDDGILDKMMKKNTNAYKLLKYRGIPIHTGNTKGDEYIRAYIPTKSVGGKKTDPDKLVKIWDVRGKKNRNITSPYITQPIIFSNEQKILGSGGDIDGEEWKNYEEVIQKGGYFRGFLLPTDQNMSTNIAESLIPNRCTIKDATSTDINVLVNTASGGNAGIFGYKQGRNDIDNLTKYGYTNEFKPWESDTLLGNYVSLSVYYSNIYRTLYDIIYSNPAFIGAKINHRNTNNSSDWFYLGLEAQNIINGQFKKSPRDKETDIGGYVNINGGIPGTNYEIPNGRGISNALFIPGNRISGGNIPKDVNQIRQVLQFRFTNTPRTAYNTILLKKSINPNIKKSYIDAANDWKYNDIAPKTIDINIPRFDNLKCLENISTGKEGELVIGLSEPDDLNIKQNLWLANAGGYKNTIYPDNKPLNTPTGILSARYNTSNTANGDITNDFPLSDSIPNDDVIEAVIYRFAKMIFNNLDSPNYLTTNKSDAIKYFAYRLSRSLIVVKDSIFNAPLFQEYNELASDYENDKYFGGTDSGNNKAAKLFNNETSGKYNKNLKPKDRQDNATYSQNAQPLTLSLTTMFREAFTRMMNKAILTRHLNRDINKRQYTFDKIAKYIDDIGNDSFNNMTADELIADHSYIAGCAGMCQVLVKLDVSDILLMQDESTNFHFISYLRDCLDSERNILKYNFEFTDNKTFRPCSAGVTQLKNVNYNSIWDIRNYMSNDILMSKASFLSRLQNIDAQFDRNRIAMIDIVRQKAVDEIQPIIQDIVDAIIDNRPMRANAGFAALVANFRGALSEYKSIHDIYMEQSRIIDNQLLQLNQILESGKEVDYGRLETRITRLYNKKESILNEFEAKYDQTAPKIIVTIDELRKVKEKIETQTIPNLSKMQRDALANRIGQVIDRLTTTAEEQIPGIVSEILETKDMDKLVNLTHYVNYILKDPILKGGVWVPIKVGIFVKQIVKQQTLFPIQYKLFNIFTGEEVALKENMDLRAKIEGEGKILVASSPKNNNWFFYKEKPDESKLGNKVPYDEKMEYLNGYRKRLFTEYGQLGYFDKIVQPWVKRTLYMVGANKSLQNVKSANTKTMVQQCGNNRKQCQGFIYFDELTDRLLEIIKQTEAKVAPQQLKEKLVKGKDKELEGTTIAPITTTIATPSTATTTVKTGGNKKKTKVVRKKVKKISNKKKSNKKTYNKVIVL